MEAHLGEEDGADERVVLEPVKNAHALDLRSRSVDKRLAELDCVHLQAVPRSVCIAESIEVIPLE
jgi:hypothetical protein